MYRLICSVLLALSLSGCASVDASKKTITYDKAMWKYETAIRWVDFGTANSLRRLEDQSAYTPDLSTLQHIRVTSYTLIQKTISEGNSQAQLAVEITYYNDQTMKLVTIIDNQIWKYDPVIKDWYISTPLPPFK
jgi:hypothetical protein